MGDGVGRGGPGEGRRCVRGGRGVGLGGLKVVLENNFPSTW